LERPNIVFIMTDTQGANVVGCYGRPEMRTPRIDQLAGEGIRFDRAYTTCPLCTPARAGLFTGLYPHQAGAWTNHLPIGDNIKTIGQRFKDQGYNTAYTGKWHLDGHDYLGTGICPDGWDPQYWYDGRNHLESLEPGHGIIWRSKLNTYEQIKEFGVTPEFTWAHQVSNRAIDFIEKNANKDAPFLAVVSYDEPHGPFTCPAEYIEPFLDFEYDIGPAAYDDLSDKPEHHRAWADSILNKPLHVNGKIKKPLYFGCNSFVDHEIGRVLDAIDNNAKDNTVVIFTSDHGGMLGAHQLAHKGPLMYEEINRIPLIVRVTGNKQAGCVDPHPVSHIDLMPTMMDMAGMKPVPFLDGKSICKRLDNPGSVPDDPVFIEYNQFEVGLDRVGGFQPIRGVVRGNMKMGLNLLDKTDELYDLEKDPHEMNNLINDPEYAEAAKELHKVIIDWMHERRDPFRGPAWEKRSWIQTNYYNHWTGSIRPKPGDGYSPTITKYATGEEVRSDETVFD
jgi:uncharacterized sulfatase